MPSAFIASAPIAGVMLVLGGARSGKSRHAEALIARHPPPWRYVATAQAFDEEMRERIAQHRARRGEAWHTVEAPYDVRRAIADAGDMPVLVDCLTLWLSNLMLAEQDIEQATDALADTIAARGAPTVLVSNEVGLGIVPDNALARRFRDEAGLLHQRLGEISAHVVLMVAGIPIIAKATP